MRSLTEKLSKGFLALNSIVLTQSWFILPDPTKPYNISIVQNARRLNQDMFNYFMSNKLPCILRSFKSLDHFLIPFAILLMCRMRTRFSFDKNIVCKNIEAGEKQEFDNIPRIYRSSTLINSSVFYYH